MRTRFRSLVAAVAVTAAALTGGVTAAAPASAAPVKPVPQFAPLGQTVPTVGDHDYCRGNLTFRFSSPRRAVVRVTVVSNGFTGNGAGWRKDPVCRMRIGTSHISANSFFKATYFNAEFGAKRGQEVSHDVFTGSGLVDIGFGTYAYNTRGPIPQGLSTAAYLIVP